MQTTTIQSLDEDLAVSIILVDLPIHELRGHLFKEKGWNYNLLGGSLISKSQTSDWKQAAIYVKFKDDTYFIASRSLQKLKEYKKETDNDDQTKSPASEAPSSGTLTDPRP